MAAAIWLVKSAGKGAAAANGINKISLRERETRISAECSSGLCVAQIGSCSRRSLADVRTNRRIVRFGVCVGRLTHSAGALASGLHQRRYAAWDKRIEVAGRECARALLKHSFKAPHVHRILCAAARDAASRTASRRAENARRKRCFWLRGVFPSRSLFLWKSGWAGINNYFLI